MEVEEESRGAVGGIREDRDWLGTWSDEDGCTEADPRARRTPRTNGRC